MSTPTTALYWGSEAQLYIQYSHFATSSCRHSQVGNDKLTVHSFGRRRVTPAWGCLRWCRPLIEGKRRTCWQGSAQSACHTDNTSYKQRHNHYIRVGNIWGTKLIFEVLPQNLIKFPCNKAILWLSNIHDFFMVNAMETNLKKICFYWGTYGNIPEKSKSHQRYPSKNLWDPPMLCELFACYVKQCEIMSRIKIHQE